MDIERLKKLNSLAGELKHQGIAQNHEDAAYLAVSMVGEEGEQCLSDMHINDDQSLVIREIIRDKPVKKAETHSEREESAEAREKVPTPTIIQSGITKEDVEKVMQTFATALVAEFSTLQKKIEETNQQLVQLQQKMSERAVVQQAVPQQKMTQFMEDTPVRTQVQEAVQSQAPIQHVEHPSAVQAANPRTGSFVTNDVCIEKMFYFGTKR